MSKNKNKNILQKNYNQKKQDGTINNIALDDWSVPVYTKNNILLDNFFEKKTKKNLDIKKNMNYIIKDGGSYIPSGNSLYRGTESPVLVKKQKTECQKRYERKQVLFAINKNGRNSGNYKKTRSKIGC